MMPNSQYPMIHKLKGNNFSFLILLLNKYAFTKHKEHHLEVNDQFFSGSYV